MNAIATPSRNLQSVRQMQVLANKIVEIAAQAEALLKSKTVSAASEGLVAVGLCKQARVQIGAACQHLGLAVDNLAGFSTNPSVAEVQVGIGLTVAARTVQNVIDVPEQAILPGIETFVSELLVIAAIATARAEEHVKLGAKADPSGLRLN